MALGTMADVSALTDAQAMTAAAAGKTISAPPPAVVADYTHALVQFAIGDPNSVNAGQLVYTVHALVNGERQSATYPVSTLGLDAAHLTGLKAILARCYLTAVGT